MMTSKHQRVQWQTQENICNNNTIHERRQFGWGHNFRLGFKDFISFNGKHKKIYATTILSMRGGNLGGGIILG
jgi:hypothetical protein